MNERYKLIKCSHCLHMQAIEEPDLYENDKWVDWKPCDNCKELIVIDAWLEVHVSTRKPNKIRVKTTGQILHTLDGREGTKALIDTLTHYNLLYNLTKHNVFGNGDNYDYYYYTLEDIKTSERRVLIRDCEFLGGGDERT